MKDPVKAGVVGCSSIGQYHAEAYASHPRTVLQGVVDIDERKARQLGERYQVNWYKSLEVMLASHPFDAVSVATTTPTHAELVIQCLKQGINVMCEKPLARDLAEAKLMVEKAKERELSLSVNFNRRCAPAYEMARRMAQKYGTVHEVYSSLFQDLPIAHTKHVPPEALLVHDMASHILDILQYLNGEVNEVFAMNATIERPVISDVCVDLAFKNGSIGCVQVSFAGVNEPWDHPIERTEILAEKGRIVIRNIMEAVEFIPHGRGPLTTWTPGIFTTSEYTSTVVTSVQRWIDSLISKAPPPVTAEEGLRVVRVCSAIVESLKTRRVVTVDEVR